LRMSKNLTIENAADFLKVTKQTLRNWDKTGKLSPERDKENNYRVYSMEQLETLKSEETVDETRSKYSLMSELDTKRFVSKLHRFIRDLESNSNIIDRFDELSKFLFLRLTSENWQPLFMESEDEYAVRLKCEYKEKISKTLFNTPKKFGDIHLSDKSIVELARFLDKYDFTNLTFDLKGILYEEMIKNTFDKGANQQFFTPNLIVGFICSMMKESLSGNVCDPAAGTGSFLVKLIKEKPDIKKYFSLEIDERLSWVSALNMSLHGCERFESKYFSNGGSLGSDAEIYQEAFDVIITNPPFGSDFSDAKELGKYYLGKGKLSRRRGILFIERCFFFLKEDGWIAIIIDDSVLNSSSNEDVREFILKNAEVHAVISLPTTSFSPYASVQASILIMRKKQSSKEYKTFFAKSERVGKKLNGEEDIIYSDSGEALLNSDLDEIYNAWTSFRNGNYSSSTENIYTKSIFDAFEIEKEHSYRLDFSFHHPSRSLVKEAVIGHSRKLVRLGDICDEMNDSITPSKAMPDETIFYTGLAHIESNSDVCFQVRVPANSIKSSVKKYQIDDVLFSKMRPELRKSVCISFSDTGYCSSECIVLRAKKKNGRHLVSPKLLAAILRSDFVFGQIVHLIAGIGRPRISIKELRNIMIPIPSDELEGVLLDQYRSSMSHFNAIRAKANKMLDEARCIKTEAPNEIVKIILGT
jgi:type I restriction enzyme M protein